MNCINRRCCNEILDSTSFICYKLLKLLLVKSNDMGEMVMKKNELKDLLDYIDYKDSLIDLDLAMIDLMFPGGN